MRSRYKRQLIRLNMKKKWPTRAGKEDSRPIFFCKRFSYNENALYSECLHGTRQIIFPRVKLGTSKDIPRHHTNFLIFQIGELFYLYLKVFCR